MESKNFTLNMKQYNRYLADFINYKENFKVIHNGSAIIIECRDMSWRFIDYGGISGNGYHLSKFVYEDARNYILNNPNSNNLKPKKEGSLTDNVDLEVQKANMKGLKKHEGQQIYCVDVNNCYWDTAYKMGFITQTTYLKGLKKKEWKIGRNASIGGLSKVVVESVFVDGIKIESAPIKPEVDLSIIRDSIVSHVHESFLSILKRLGDDWLMYFTDCVYVPLDKVNEVQEYFKELGYHTKVTTYQLDKVNLETGMINWYDYQKNKAKGFAFSERQKSLSPTRIFGDISNMPKSFTFIKDIHEIKKLDNNEDFLNVKPKKIKKNKDNKSTKK
jgi:hypothetical protein